MSPARQRLTVEQEPFLAVRSFACGYSSGTTIEPHHHDWHQLLWARTGSMSVDAERQSWTIPPNKAVVIPAGCSHAIRMWGNVAMRSLAFPGTLEDPALTSCRVVSVTPLLSELILRVVETPA